MFVLSLKDKGLIGEPVIELLFSDDELYETFETAKILFQRMHEPIVEIEKIEKV